MHGLAGSSIKLWSRCWLGSHLSSRIDCRKVYQAHVIVGSTQFLEALQTEKALIFFLTNSWKPSLVSRPVVFSIMVAHNIVTCFFKARKASSFLSRWTLQSYIAKSPTGSHVHTVTFVIFCWIQGHHKPTLKERGLGKGVNTRSQGSWELLRVCPAYCFISSMQYRQGHEKLSPVRLTQGVVPLRTLILS